MRKPESAEMGAAQQSPTRSRRAKVFLALFGLLVGALLAEVAVRLLVPVRNVGPSFSRFDPVYGKGLKRSFSCTRTTPEFSMRLTTNSLGLRGPELPADADMTVLFIGDSFTMGYGVNDEEEFPALVRRRLASLAPDKSVRVVNAGIGDVGNGRWATYLEDEADVWSPDVVVLQVCANDFRDNLRERLFEIAEDGTLVRLHRTYSRGLARTAQAVIEGIPGLAYSHMVSLLRETRFRGRRSATSMGDVREAHKSSEHGDDDELTYRIVQEIIGLCRARDWPVVLVVADFDGPRKDRLAVVAGSSGTRFVGVPTKIERPDLYYRVDGHWNAAGHLFLADQLLPTILDAAATTGASPD